MFKKIAAIAIVVTFSSAAFAADGDVASWEGFGKGLWEAVMAYVSGPAVVAFIMAQLRAMFPMLGNLGVLTMVGDIIAGNWGHAKNVK